MDVKSSAWISFPLHKLRNCSHANANVSVQSFAHLISNILHLRVKTKAHILGLMNTHKPREANIPPVNSWSAIIIAFHFVVCGKRSGLEPAHMPSDFLPVHTRPLSCLLVCWHVACFHTKLKRMCRQNLGSQGNEFICLGHVHYCGWRTRYTGRHCTLLEHFIFKDRPERSISFSGYSNFLS